MIQNREFRQYCREVQRQNPKFSLEEIMEMVKDSFLFANEHIAGGSLTPIYFQYLGRFSVSKGRRNWIKKNKDDTDFKQELHSDGSGKAPPEDDGVQDILGGTEET